MIKTISLKIILYILILLPSIGYSLPITITPKIEGTITDSTTGKPIAFVKMYVIYWEKGFLSRYVRIGSSPMYKEYIFTDKDGKYKIFKRTNIDWSRFGYLDIHFITHPLYRSISIEIDKEKLPRWDKKSLKENKIEYNLSMESLKTYYSKDKSISNLKEFYRIVKLYLAKENTIKELIDLGKINETDYENIINEFDTICNLFPEDPHKYKIKEYIKLLKENVLLKKPFPDFDILLQHQRKGLDYWKHKKYDSAIREFVKLIEICGNKLPDLEDDKFYYQYALINIACIYKEIGDYTKAKQYFEYFILTNPNLEEEPALKSGKMNYEYKNKQLK